MKMTNLLKLLFIVLLTTSLGWSAEENLGSAFPEHVQLRTDLKPKVKGVMVEATIDQIGTTQLFAGSDNVQFQVQLEFKKFKKGLPKAMAARIAKADNVTEAFAILNSSKASQTELLEGWRSHYQTKKLTRGPTAIVMPDGQIRITDGHHGGLGAAKVDQDIQRLAKTIRAKVKRIKYPVEIVEGGNYYQSSRAAAKKSGLVSTTAEYDAVAKAHRNGTAAPTGKSKTYSFLDGRTNDSAEALLSARKQGKGYLNYDNVITILGEENIKLGSSRVEAYKKIHELRKGPPSKTFADIIVDASATKGKSTTYADVIKKFQSNIGKIPNDPYRSLGGNFYFHEWEAKLSDKGYQFFNADDFVDYSQKDWAQKMKEPPNNLPDQIAKKFRGQFGKDNGGKLFKLFEEGKDIALEDISKIMSKDEFLNSNYYKNLKKLNPAKAAKLAGKLDDPLAFAKMLKNEVWDSAYQVSRDVFYSRPQNIDDLVDLLKHPKDMKNLGRVDDVKAIIAEAKLKYVDRRTKELRRLGKSQAAISIEERIASQKYNLPEMGDIKKGTRLREGVRSSGTIDRIKTRLKNLFALPDDAAKIKTPGHGGKIHFVDIELVGATQDAAGHSNVGGQVKREFDGFQKTVMRGEKLKDIKLSGKAISAKSFEDIISATKDLPASEQMKIIRSYREYYQNQKIAGRAPTAVMMPDGRIRITDGHHGGLGTARAQNTIDKAVDVVHGRIVEQRSIELRALGNLDEATIKAKALAEADSLAQVKRLEYQVEIVADYRGMTYEDASKALLSNGTDGTGVIKASRAGKGIQTVKAQGKGFVDLESIAKAIQENGRGSNNPIFSEFATLKNPDDIVAARAGVVDEIKRLSDAKKAGSISLADVLNKHANMPYEDVIKNYYTGRIGQIPNSQVRSLGGNFVFKEFEDAFGKRAIFNADDMVEYSQSKWGQSMKEAGLEAKLAEKLKNGSLEDLLKTLDIGGDNAATKQINAILETLDLPPGSYAANKDLVADSLVKSFMRGDDIKPVKLINGILDVAHDASSDIFFKSPKLVEEFRDMVKDPSKLKLFDDNMAERIFEYGRRTDQLDDVAKLAYSERTNKMIKLFDKFAKACK